MFDSVQYQILSQLDKFRQHGLEDIASSNLMDRVDSKYLLQADQLCDFLQNMDPDFSVLNVEDNLLSYYENTYFDDLNRRYYLQHHNGHANRLKVRTRRYVKQDLTFLELKFKTNKNRTYKHRLPCTNFQSVQAREFMLSHGVEGISKLQPVQHCHYHRICFADENNAERLTLDLNVKFEDLLSGKHHQMENTIIVELKQAKANKHSPFSQLIKHTKLPATKFSKYCMGTRFVKPEGVKSNQFKPIERNIIKLENNKNA